MTRVVVGCFVLLLLSAGFCSAQQHRPILVSLRPEVEIPLPPDPRLFKPGGGVGMKLNHVFPFLRPLSAGIGVVGLYHLIGVGVGVDLWLGRVR